MGCATSSVVRKPSEHGDGKAGEKGAGTVPGSQQARVELRYYGGLTIEEVGEVVRISPSTMVREWTMAKAWLRAELSR
jgi:DNA-directed RNA polymerase specialized sigma subunit